MASKWNFTSRTLSAQETLTDLGHPHGSSVRIHAVFLSSKVSLSEETFLIALHRLVDFQPMLKTKITSEYISQKSKRTVGTKIVKRFQEMEDTYVDFEYLKDTRRDSWIPLAEKELALPFQSHVGPLWKVVFMEFIDQISCTGYADSDLHAATGGMQSSEQRYTIWAGSIHSHLSYGEDPFQGVLLFKLHGAISDDVSIFDLIHRQLVPLLNDTLTANSVPKYATPIHMMPSASQAFPRNPFNKKQQSVFNLKHAMESAKHTDVVDGGVCPPQPAIRDIGAFINPTEKALCKLWCYKLPRKLTPLLISCCEKYGVSLLDCLIASASVALNICSQQQNVDFSSNHVTSIVTMDLRQFHQQQSGMESLGQWDGYDIIQLKRSLCDFIPKPHQFWNLVKQVAPSKLQPQSPWDGLSVSEETLNIVEKQKTLRAMAEVCKCHMAISLLTEMTSADDVYNYVTSLGAHTESLPVQWVTGNGCFSMRSVSDISNAPICLNFVVHLGRTYCALTYNPRWVTEDIVKKFISLKTNILSSVV